MTDAVAVTGRGLVTALGAGLDVNWRAVISGKSGLGATRRFGANRFFSGIAGEVPEEVERRLKRDLAPASERRALLFALAAAREALTGAGKRSCRDAALVLSTTKGEMDIFERSVEAEKYASAARALPWQLARDVAACLGVSRGVLVVSNACASGLAAVIQAARMINRGEAGCVIVVGVDILSRFVLAGFSSLAALSGGTCRPYDANRDGLNIGEGAGALLLEKSSPYAIAYLKGSGVTNDAAHITAPSRSGDGLRRAITRALAAAGVSPGEIDAVNGHGTGTLYNDKMEAKALSDVFGPETPPVYSLKGHVGHTLGAAGVIEAVIAIKALEEGRVPPTLGLVEPDRDIRINVSPGPRNCQSLRVLSIKSGFGGINAAAVFERAAS